MGHFKKFCSVFICLVFSLASGNRAKSQTTGLLCGTTRLGGNFNGGTLFSFDPLSNQYNVLVNFSPFGNPSNGGFPQGSLIQERNTGLLFGLTYNGGANNMGVLFSYNLSTGKDSTRFSFAGPNGANPAGSLVQASDGMLYGLTQLGGTNNLGTLFRFNPVTGVDTVLLNMDDSTGTDPTGSLIQAKDGKLYGLTQHAGRYNFGTLLQIDPATYKDTVLVHFNFSDGAFPLGSLVQDTDGILYALTFSGGSIAKGILFSYNILTGKDTVLMQLNDSTGYFPQGSLVHDTNGVLFGMTSSGSAYGFGNLFSYTPATYKDTVLQRFNLDYGESPYGTPIIASNGLLYGLTSGGGINNQGELFDFNLTTGHEDTLYAFNNNSGYLPYGDLLEAMVVSAVGFDSLKCFGDSNAWAKAIVRGAKMPVTYLWNNSSTTDSVGGLKAGTYSCIITDAAGKTFNLTFIVSQPPMLYANTFIRNACSGTLDSAWASPFGGVRPYSYHWNNGSTMDTIRNLLPGRDTCFVTDSNGCVAKGVVVVDTAKPLKIDSIVTHATRCNGCIDGSATVYVSGGIPAGDSAIYYYLWTFGPDSATVHGIPAGYDKVCVTSYYGCYNPGVCDSGLVITGINTINNEKELIKVYPVPGNGNVTVLMPGNGYEQISVTDELGREVYTEQLDEERNNYTMHLNLSNQPNGIYIMQFFTKQGLVTRKLVIEK